MKNIVTALVAVSSFYVLIKIPSCHFFLFNDKVELTKPCKMKGVKDYEPSIDFSDSPNGNETRSYYHKHD